MVLNKSVALCGFKIAKLSAKRIDVRSPVGQGKQPISINQRGASARESTPATSDPLIRLTVGPGAQPRIRRGSLGFAYCASTLPCSLYDCAFTCLPIPSLSILSRPLTYPLHYLP